MKSEVENMTRKDLAHTLFKAKKKLGEPLVPIGRNKPLTEQEFTKRYLNGIGGTKGFKKAELIELNKTYAKKLKKHK